ncbi:MAG: hypothetical protein ISS71_03430 [Phycisphaerae bacterium]|nr:hypothetical protein [Phycisphaerae bacterium]
MENLNAPQFFENAEPDYHLHNEESHSTMMDLAKSHNTERVHTPNKGNGPAKTSKEYTTH